MIKIEFCSFQSILKNNNLMGPMDMPRTLVQLQLATMDPNTVFLMANTRRAHVNIAHRIAKTPLGLTDSQNHPN